jgi:hypothetical protein
MSVSDLDPALDRRLRVCHAGGPALRYPLYVRDVEAEQPRDVIALGGMRSLALLEEVGQSKCRPC